MTKGFYLNRKIVVERKTKTHKEKNHGDKIMNKLNGFHLLISPMLNSWRKTNSPDSCDSKHANGELWRLHFKCREQGGGGINRREFSDLNGETSHTSRLWQIPAFHSRASFHSGARVSKPTHGIWGQVILYWGRFLHLVETPQTPQPLFYDAGSIPSQLRQREVLCILPNIPCFGILMVKAIVLHSLPVGLGLWGCTRASWVPC